MTAEQAERRDAHIRFLRRVDAGEIEITLEDMRRDMVRELRAIEKKGEQVRISIDGLH